MKKLLITLLAFPAVVIRLNAGIETTKPTEHTSTRSQESVRHQDPIKQIDVRHEAQEHTSRPSTVIAYDQDTLVQAVTDSNVLVTHDTFRKIENIHAQLAMRGPSTVQQQDLAWYLNVMKKTPAARGEVITIIEHLSKDPKQIITHAQEIADAINAFDYIPQNFTGKVQIKDLNDLSDKQVSLLVSIANTLFKSERPHQAITIVNELINRRTQGIILAPTLLEAIKNAITDQQINNREFKLTVREMLNTAATNIDQSARNAISFIDFAELVEQTKVLHLDKAIYQSWYQTIDKKINDIIKNGTLPNMQPQEFARLVLIKPELVTMLLTTAPEASIIILNKLFDNRILTTKNFDQIMVIQKAALNSMTAETFKTLIKAKKLPDILALFTKIADIMGMEGLSQEQRVDLHKYVTDLTQTYLEVLARNDVLTVEIINNKALKAMDADTLIRLGQITQAVMEQEPVLGMDLLTQLVDTSLLTTENFDKIMAIQKATIDTMSSKALATLIKANKIDNVSALLTKIIRLENNPQFDAKQREVLERHVADLLQSYLTVLQPQKNNPALASKIKNTMDRLVENAKDTLTLVRSLKVLDTMRTFVTEKQRQQWLQALASKAQEIRKADTTLAKLNASLGMAELANKAGLDTKTYQQWIKNIVDKNLDLFVINKLQDRDITPELLDSMQTAAQLLQTQTVFDSLTRLSIEEVRNYVNKIKAYQTDLLNAIDGFLLSQPANRQVLATKKQVLDDTYSNLIKKLEANYKIREKAKQIVQ